MKSARQCPLTHPNNFNCRNHIFMAQPTNHSLLEVFRWLMIAGCSSKSGMLVSPYGNTAFDGDEFCLLPLMSLSDGGSLEKHVITDAGRSRISHKGEYSSLNQMRSFALRMQLLSCLLCRWVEERWHKTLKQASCIPLPKPSISICLQKRAKNQHSSQMMHDQHSAP